VVYLLQHGPLGALGIILNMPTPHEAPTPIEHWSTHLSYPAVVFRGGPVQPNGIITLGRQGDGMTETVDLRNATPQDFDEIRLFHGHAGWGPKQLDNEITEGSWFVFPARSQDIFPAQPKNLWYEIFQRQSEPLRWLAHYPDNLSTN
jgi:putative transcriptional regulator